MVRVPGSGAYGHTWVQHNSKYEKKQLAFPHKVNHIKARRKEAFSQFRIKKAELVENEQFEKKVRGLR